MGIWAIEKTHRVVDVDGQLLAIDTGVIDTASLLERANRPDDCHLWQVQAGERFFVEPKMLLRLPEDEVLFFETSAAWRSQTVHRLAA